MIELGLDVNMGGMVSRICNIHTKSAPCIGRSNAYISRPNNPRV